MRPTLLALALLALAAAPAGAANPVVRFTTVLGSYDVELCAELSPACPGVAPDTVANLLQYVDADRYPPTGFIHRRGVNFGSPPVIQGGGYWIEEAPGDDIIRLTTTFPDIALEIDENLSNVRGTIAMARGSATNSANSQWFVNLADNTTLDGFYAVFGRVVTGLDVVDAIAAVPVYAFASPFSELPLIEWPGGNATVIPHLVYVSGVERVPAPGAAAGGGAALLALAGLARWRARAR